MWLIAGVLLAALVIWVVVRRKTRPAKRQVEAPDPYVCTVCNDRHCECEKPGRQPPEG